MTELFGSKSGTGQVCARLLSDVLGVRFRPHPVDGGGPSWYVARDGERHECLVILPNRSVGGQLLEPYAANYEVLLYVDSSPRPEEIARKVASDTSFRFLQCGDRLRAAVESALRQGNP